MMIRKNTLRDWFNVYKIDPDLLSRKGDKSSMRYVMVRILRLTEHIVYVSLFVQVIVAFKSASVDWTGYSLFIGSITTLIGAAVTGKWLQKKEEVKQDMEENNEN